MDNLIDDTINACTQYGAYNVRKAALLAQKGDRKALGEVGLTSYVSTIYDNLLLISNIAFDEMTDVEKFDDFEAMMRSKRNP